MSKTNNFLHILSAYFTNYLPTSKGLSENSIRSYQYAFQLLFRFLKDEKGLLPKKVNFKDIEGPAIEEFLLWLEDSRTCSISTRNQRLSAVSAFASYAINRKPAEALGFYTAVSIIPFKKRPKHIPVYLTLKEISILLKLPDGKTVISSRDKVLLSVLYATGARAQELCDITVGDIRFNEKTSVKLVGKGNKGRIITIPDKCSKLLFEHLKGQRIIENPKRHAFSSQTHEHMTISCIEGIMKKYILQAKKQNPTLFLEKSYTPHSLRHSIAVHMLESGIPLPVIKNFLGHTSLESTMIYATVSEDLTNHYIKSKSIMNELLPSKTGIIELQDSGLEFLKKV